LTNNTPSDNLFAGPELKVSEKLQRIGDGPGNDVRDGSIRNPDRKALRFQPRPMTGSTRPRHHDVGQVVGRKQILSIVAVQQINDPVNVFPTIFDAVENRSLDLRL